MLLALQRRNLSAITVSGNFIISTRSLGVSRTSEVSENANKIIYCLKSGSFSHFESLSCYGRREQMYFSLMDLG